MLEKSNILREIKETAAARLVTRDEIIAAYDEGSGRAAKPGIFKRITIAELLYYIGGGIVFLGIAVLVFQHWNELTPAVRILATLGSGIAAYIVGVLFTSRDDFNTVGSAFYFLSALLMPIGLGVAFDAAGYATGESSIQAMMAALLTAMYLASYAASRRVLFIIFSIIFGTWFFFTSTSWLVAGNPIAADWNFFEYRGLVTGLTHIFLGYAFAREPSEEPSALASWLYSVGIVIFLTAALALGRYSPDANAFWEILFPGLVFGAILLSVRLHSRSFLAFGSLFLMIYILKITAEYFSDSLGWPLALVLAGFALIATGYASLYVNRRYLKAQVHP